MEQHEDECSNVYIMEMSNLAFRMSFKVDRTLTEYEQQHLEELHRYLRAHHKLNRLALEATIRDMEGEDE